MKNLILKKFFLLPNISINIILKIFILIFLDINLQFTKKKLIQKNYIIIKALLNFKNVQLINKKEFEVIIISLDFEIYCNIYSGLKNSSKNRFQK